MLKFNSSKKSMRCRLHVKKYGKIDVKHLLQFPDKLSPILGSTENTTFVHLPKKSKYLKADFFVISSNIVLASEWTTSRIDLCYNRSIFGRFMTSEGTDALILAFTSKTGQSVARYTHRIFLFGFFNQREDIFTHFKGLISSSRHKGFARKN